MDKKQLTIVSIIGALIVVLVCFVVFSSENTDRLTKNQILRIEDKIYDLEDLEKYLVMYNEANGDIDKELSEADKEGVFEAYIRTRVYSSVADKKKILFPEEELTRAKEDYSKKADSFKKYGIKEDDFVAYKEAEYKMNTLYSTFSTYYELPEEVYQSFVEMYSGDDLKTYSFRTMNFRYEEPKSGEDEKVPSGDEVDRRKTSVLAKAELALSKAKSGDDFQTIAKEYSDGTYTIANNTLQFLNGDLQHAIAPILQSKLGSTELYEAVKELEVGGYTDLVQPSGDTTYYFAKLEALEDGFTGEAAKEVKEQLLNEYQETLLIEDLDYEANNGALVRFLYK